MLGAVARAGGDWHQAFHELSTRKGRSGEIAWSTFVGYAGSRTDTYQVRENDHAAPDVADAVVDALSPADPTPDTDLRVRRVQEAVWKLPKRQREAVVSWSLGHSLTESQRRNFRRARESLCAALADLSGAHVLREPRERAPQEVFPVAVRVGEPRTPRQDTHLPVRMLEGIEFHRVVRPTWSREWVDSVPPVPANWASLPPGTPWMLSPEAQTPRSRRVAITSIQAEL